MPTDTNETTTRDENIPFFEPVPAGYILMGGVEERICDHDFYNTGDPDRVNGCGGTYYQRYYSDPLNMIHCERTACKCMLGIMQQRQDMKQKERLSQYQGNVLRQADFYFGAYDLLRDPVHAHMFMNRYKPDHTTQAQALEVMKGFRIGQDSALLYGGSGRGKTHLAISAAREAKQQGYSSLALKTVDLLNRIKKTYDSKNRESESEIMFVLRNVDLLVLDDIGIEQSTEWAIAKMYEAIDYRHKRKSTIFTSNLTGKEIKDKLGPAMVSRIWGAGIRIEIEGKDWRVV